MAYIEASRDAELARLSGPELVAHLRVTWRRDDYDAAARVLDARDRRLALAEAALDDLKPEFDALKPEFDALRQQYAALQGARRGATGSDTAAAAAGTGERSVGAVSIAATAAARAPRRAERAEEKGGSFVDLCSSDDEPEECRVLAVVSGGGSCKRNATATPSSSGDEDDTIPLNQFLKKRRGPQPGANGESKTGNRDAVTNSSRPLGNGLREIRPVIREGPEARAKKSTGGSEGPKAAGFVQERGNGQSIEGGGMHSAMPSSPPPGFAIRSGSWKNFSQADDGGRTGTAEAEAYTTGPSQATTPCFAAGKVVESVTVSEDVSATNKEHAVSGLGEIGGMIERPIGEQNKADGQVHNTNVLSETNGTSKQLGDADSSQTPEVRTRGQLRTSDKPLSAALQPKKQFRLCSTPSLASEPKVVTFVKGNGNGKSAEDGGISKAMPSSLPMVSTVGNLAQENSFMAEDGGARIGEKEAYFAGLEEDTLFQVKTPSLMAKKMVESAGVGDETPEAHTGSALGVIGSVVLGLEVVRKQAKTKGLIHKTNMLPVKKRIVGRGQSLSSCQTREVLGGVQLRTSGKLVSDTSQLNNQLRLAVAMKGRGNQKPMEDGVTLKRHWESDSDVFDSCLENKEICMQAACALYRQKKLTTKQTGGGIGCIRLSKSDTRRVAELAEFLLDGNIRGPLQRTYEEVVKHDVAGASLLEKVVLESSKQLFDIYRNKEDPYFL